MGDSNWVIYKFRNVNMSFIVYPFKGGVPDFTSPCGDFKTEYEAQKWVAMNGEEQEEDDYLILPKLKYIRKSVIDNLVK